MIYLPPIMGDVWINSKPLEREDLLGKVILVDFWTYSCVNCLRTMPYLRRWWEKFKGKDFLIIGIHTPEFEFEKELKNVQAAVRELGIEWPVVLDNNYINWDSFANHYWPAKYLSDKKGRIVYTHFGEGGYSQAEKLIQALLKGEDIRELPKSEISEPIGSVCFIPTPELYCGYLRGYLSNSGGYAYDMTEDYLAPERLEENSIGLVGKFLARGEYVESKEVGASIQLRFRATEVNLVMEPAGESSVIEVLLNGNNLSGHLRGKDVDDNSQVLVKRPRMYNLLRGNEIVEGILVIRSLKEDVRFFAFTFSGCLS